MSAAGARPRSPPWRCRAGVAAIGLALALGAAQAPAQTRPAVGATPATTPLLHERPPIRFAPSSRSDRVVGRGGAGALPGAIATAQGRIDAPRPQGAEVAADAGAPIYPAPPASGSTPPPQIRPDAATGAEGALHYRVVFDPSVAPFKRDLAFDHAAADGSLRQSGGGLRPLALQTGQGRPGFELFWGHVRLQLVAGRRTPLPSVAPDAGILAWQATPALPLTIARDDAGNFSVALAATAAVGSADAPAVVELRFLTDAPSTYFARPLGDQRPRQQPPVSALPPPLLAQVQALWPQVGVHPQQSHRHNLEALARWFRSFEPGPGPRPGAQLVSELISLRKGICRHRTHGFVLVAWSLGIAAHYVMNDAHAFAEVWAVGAGGHEGWLRVDLGGGAESLELHGAAGHGLHTPLHGDPLPRPPAYAAQLGQPLAEPSSAAGDQGATGGSWAGAGKVVGAEGFQRRAAAKPAPSNAGGAAAQAEGAGSGADAAAKDRAWLADRARSIAAPRRPPGVDEPKTAGSGTAGEPSPPPPDPRVTTSIVLEPAAAVAFVGETMQVRGLLQAAAGAPSLAGRIIEVWLVDPRDRQQGLRLGVLRTKQGGRFAGEVALPLASRLGVWDLVVRFAGDARLQPCYSRDG